MPQKTRREKERARDLAAADVGVTEFLSVVNDGHLMNGAGLDGRIVSVLRSIATDLALNASRGTQPLGLLTEYQELQHLSRLALEAANAAGIPVVSLASLVRFGFLGEWAGWRVVARCNQCGRFFVARDDRQQFCRAECRQSRQPLRVRHRVQKHRTT